MEPFTYESLAQRVVFGTGTLATVGDELDRLGRKRALLVTTAGHAVKGQRLADDLGSRCVGHYAGQSMCDFRRTSPGLRQPSGFCNQLFTFIQ